MVPANGGLNGSVAGGSGVTSIKNEKRASWKEVLNRSVGQAGTEVGIGYWIGEGPVRK